MTSCADAAPSSVVAAETCCGPIQPKHAKTTSNARSRQLTPPSGEDVLTRGVARSTRHKRGEVLWLKIPCQDCQCVRRINVLLSCTLHCIARAILCCSAEPCPRVILTPSPFQRPLRESPGPNTA